MSGAPGYEPLVVPTDALATVIERYIVEWLAVRDGAEDRDRREGQLAPNGGAGYSVPAVEGPLMWLARESGVGERSLHRIRSGASRFTALSIADRITTALELPHLLHDGTLPVVANPRLSLERWVETMAERGCV